MKVKTDQPGGGRVVILPVKRRDAQTLEDAIKLWVDPLSTIATDCWKGYNRIENHGYFHQKVNHKRYFVHPGTGVHTNNIEATWRALRAVTNTQ